MNRQNPPTFGRVALAVFAAIAALIGATACGADATDRVAAGTPVAIFPEYDPRDAVREWGSVNREAMNASIAEWVTPQSEFTRAIGKDDIEAEFAANIGHWRFDRPVKMDGDEWRVDVYVFWYADFYNPEWDSGFGAALPYVFVVDAARRAVVSADAQYDKAEFIHVP